MLMVGRHIRTIVSSLVAHAHPHIRTFTDSNDPRVLCIFGKNQRNIINIYIVNSEWGGKCLRLSTRVFDKLYLLFNFVGE